ncbi:DNA polymerase III subunit beta [Candidatus Uhrbacteria bacterium]|nr:DNA polymerase III subunit beta [Candidatus Uhrbacteria bacterium]
MRFSCTQENLSRCLNITSRVASRAGNLPILSYVQIKATPEGIELKATNLEVGVTCRLRGKMEEVGEFTVPAKLFTEFVASLPKERVDLELKEQELKVSCGRHSTSIKGLSASEFPLIPQIENGSPWEVSTSDLVEGLDQVLFAISPTESRPEISGGLISLKNGNLIIAGTDSYRLAEKKLIAQGGEGEVRVIVPLRALQELSRICAQEQTEHPRVKLTVSTNQLAVSLPTIEFVTRLIDGQYPDYRAILPAKFGTQIILGRGELSNALKAAGLFSKTGVYDVALEFFPDQKKVGIESVSAQTGAYQSALEGEVSGAPAKIAYNWKYLLDGIVALKSEKVELKATDASSPTLLTEEKSEDYFYVVMPIKE